MAIDSVARGLAARANTAGGIAAAGGATGSNTPVSGGTLNRLPPRLAANALRYRGALAKFKQGTLGRNLRIALLSDSTTIEDSTASPLNSQGINGAASQIAKKLRAMGYQAGANALFGTQGTNNPADLKSKESRFDYSGAVAWGSQPAQGGSDIFLTSTGQYITWAPTFNVTKFVVYWRDAAVGRNFSYATKSGGGSFGSETQVNSTGTNQFASTVVDAGSADLKTIRLTWVAGNVSIYGIDAYDDTGGRTEISIWPWGIRGATTTALINNSGTPNGGRIAQAAYLAPDLIIAEAGLVNNWNNSIPVATTSANLQTMYNGVGSSPAHTGYTGTSDLIFQTPPFTNPANVSYDIQNGHVDAMFAVAQANNTDVIDWRSYLVSFAAAQAVGFLPVDVHPSAIGYSDLGDRILSDLGF